MGTVSCDFVYSQRPSDHVGLLKPLGTIRKVRSWALPGLKVSRVLKSSFQFEGAAPFQPPQAGGTVQEAAMSNRAMLE